MCTRVLSDHAHSLTLHTRCTPTDIDAIRRADEEILSRNQRIYAPKTVRNYNTYQQQYYAWVKSNNRRPHLTLENAEKFAEHCHYEFLANRKYIMAYPTWGVLRNEAAPARVHPPTFSVEPMFLPTTHR